MIPIKKTIIFCILLLVLYSGIALAARDDLSFIGKIVDENRTAVVDSHYAVSFGIYGDVTSGTLLYEFNTTEPTRNGTLSVILQNSSLLSYDQDLFLDIIFNGERQVPRLNITSTPYAFRANITDDIDCVGCVNSTHLADVYAANSSRGLNLTFGNIYSMDWSNVSGGSTYNTTYDAWSFNQTTLSIAWVALQGYITSYIDTFYDQDLNQSADVIFASVNTTTSHFAEIFSKDWTNISITRSQVSNAYDTNASTGCNDGFYLDGDSVCKDFNNTVLDMTKSIEYNATSIETLEGTLDVGDINSILKAKDADSYNVSEDAGAAPLIIEVNFSGIDDFNSIISRHLYMGGIGHEIEVCLWDYTLVDWECEYGAITDMEIFSFVNLNVLDATDHISSGEVILRFDHVQNGVGTHDFALDFISLVSGFATITTSKHDSLSGRDDTSNHPWAVATDDLNRSIFNVAGNETARFTNLTGDDCAGGTLVIGIQDNGTVLCATDDTGAAGALGNPFDQDLNESADVIFASVNTTTSHFKEIFSQDWGNISITRSQVSNAYDTNASTECAGGTTYLDGEGNCDDISGVYVDESGDTMVGTLNMGFNTIQQPDISGGRLANQFDANNQSITNLLFFQGIFNSSNNLEILHRGNSSSYLKLRTVDSDGNAKDRLEIASEVDEARVSIGSTSGAAYLDMQNNRIIGLSNLTGTPDLDLNIKSSANHNITLTPHGIGNVFINSFLNISTGKDVCIEGGNCLSTVSSTGGSFAFDTNASTECATEEALLGNASCMDLIANEWINPGEVADIDDADIETDLNTYVDIGGDSMTGALTCQATTYAVALNMTGGDAADVNITMGINHYNIWEDNSGGTVAVKAGYNGSSYIIEVF